MNKENKNFDEAAEVPQGRVSGKWHEATMIGDIETPEAQAVLALPISLLAGGYRNLPGAKWNALEMQVKDLLENILSRHHLSPTKDGNALVYAQSQLTGRTATVDGQKLRYAYRVQDKIQKVTAFFADIDGTDKARRVADRIHELGLFGVVYTTHSHAAKKTDAGDRFRIIIFLEHSFEFPAAPDTRRAAVAEYRRRYAGMCELLGLEDIDGSGMNLHQMMYTPRRASEGADFEHYVIAGHALHIDDMPEGDPSQFRKKVDGGGSRKTAKDSGEAAFLSDGFDVRAWFQDVEEVFALETFLDLLGWDVRGEANGGKVILCPNDAAHSNPGDPDDGGCWVHEGAIDERISFIITCRHDHCAGLCTWDFVKLIEANILEGVFLLPDDWDTLSELLCDPICYPEIDGEQVTVNRAAYIDTPIKIHTLKTPVSVTRSFKALPENAGDEHLAAIFAGICKAGSVGNAIAKWNEVMKERGTSANDRKRVEKRGRELLDEQKKEVAAEKAEERRAEYVEALASGKPINVSLDPAEPLGDNMRTALATLAYRYAPCDIGGKFRIVRKPDLDSFNSEVDASTIALYQKDDFLNLHLDRQIAEGDAVVNPAKVFLETEKRRSGLVFAPPPMVAGKNEFNMYQGRKVLGVEGPNGIPEKDFPVLHDFMLRIICDGEQSKLDWLTLWMAHMVQRPGEKPGTSVIAVGDGGIGKGRFGALLSRLVTPHFKQLENEAHVTGQFAGEHLSKCILVQVNEAVFGASPKISSTLKALIDSTSIQVEAKGMSVVTVPSFTRYYFDSNESVPVLIENNGSERRYFVLKVSPEERGNTDFFDTLTQAITGDEMGHLIAYLERYTPADAGLSWADVRTAPETPERRVMAYNSMRSAQRELLNILKEQSVTMEVAKELETYTADEVPGHPGLRVPAAAFKTHIGKHGNKNNPDDSDVPAMIQRLFGVELVEKQGKVGSAKNLRWWHFPPEVLGENVERMLRGE